jgi:NAD(P)-dependent dehydrogenase (short-subunit alcohol dehydrogenase family)
LQVEEAKFDKMIEINLKSAFRLIQAVAPGMCERGSGSIVNIASIAGLRPQFHGMLYSMTKAALIMMTQSYALELGPKGVRVNAIAPGLVETVFSEYFWNDEEKLRHVIDGQPIKHLGQPREIAEVALLLASDRGSYLTGQTLVVDGGRLL